MLSCEQAFKVGIIDSGVSRQYLNSQNTKLQIAGAFSIDWENKALQKQIYGEHELEAWLNGCRELEVEDHSGHGTRVLSVLQQGINHPAEFAVAKVLDADNQGSVFALLEAMRWLIDEVEVDFLNISMGTTDFRYRDKMQEYVDYAVSKGCCILSAAGGYPSLPSELDGVNAIATEPMAKHDERGIKIDTVNLVPELTITLPEGSQTLELASSFASPHILAQIISAAQAKAELLHN